MRLKFSDAKPDDAAAIAGLQNAAAGALRAVRRRLRVVALDSPLIYHEMLFEGTMHSQAAPPLRRARKDGA